MRVFHILIVWCLWTFRTPLNTIISCSYFLVFLFWWKSDVRRRSWFSWSFRLDLQPIDFIIFFLIATSSWISIGVWWINLERSIVSWSLSWSLGLLASPWNRTWFRSLSLTTPCYTSISWCLLLLTAPGYSSTLYSLMLSSWNSIWWWQRCFLIPWSRTWCFLKVNLLLIVSVWHSLIAS